MDKINAAIISGFVFGFSGLIGGTLLGSFRVSSSDNKAKEFAYQGLKVIRTYERERRDNIFIQDANDPNSYISFKNYLDNITDKYDRKIEESKIKKLVDW